MVDSPEQRLERLGLTLSTPFATMFAYQPAMRHGNTVHVGGQIPKITDEHLSVYGVLGQDVSEANAVGAVRLCILNSLSWIAHLAQDGLGDIEQVLRLNYYFQVPLSGFGRMSQVADAGSSLLENILGEKGRHVRSVLGMCELPRNSPVMLDMVVALRPASTPNPS